MTGINSAGKPLQCRYSLATLRPPNDLGGNKTRPDGKIERTCLHGNIEESDIEIGVRTQFTLREVFIGACNAINFHRNRQYWI